LGKDPLPARQKHPGKGQTTFISHKEATIGSRGRGKRGTSDIKKPRELNVLEKWKQGQLTYSRIDQKGEMLLDFFVRQRAIDEKKKTKSGKKKLRGGLQVGRRGAIVLRFSKSYRAIGELSLE